MRLHAPSVRPVVGAGGDDQTAALPVITRPVSDFGIVGLLDYLAQYLMDEGGPQPGDDAMIMSADHADSGRGNGRRDRPACRLDRTARPLLPRRELGGATGLRGGPVRPPVATATKGQTTVVVKRTLFVLPGVRPPAADPMPPRSVGPACYGSRRTLPRGPPQTGPSFASRFFSRS